MIFEFIFNTLKNFIKMRLKFVNIIILFFMVSCGGNDSKSFELQEFSKVEVESFKKKNVELSTSIRFYNSDDLSVKVVYAEFDVLVNGKDVDTFISKNSKEIPSNGIYELPIEIDFAPESAFLNLDYGIVKIKSDVVADVEISGFITTMKNDKKKDIKFNSKQKVLFSNNKKLYLDENGALKEK